jgi:hypothetical protein
VDGDGAGVLKEITIHVDRDIDAPVSAWYSQGGSSRVTYWFKHAAQHARGCRRAVRVFVPLNGTHSQCHKLMQREGMMHVPPMRWICLQVYIYYELTGFYGVCQRDVQQHCMLHSPSAAAAGLPSAVMSSLMRLFGVGVEAAAA